MKTGPTFRKSVVARAIIMALCGTGGMLLAQETLAQQTSQQDLQRVEVTGSAIRRVDAESAVPITVLKTEELKQQGLTTVEEIVNTLGGNQSLTSTSGAIGASTGGASFANLRGLGANKTLVLLNGRRIANNAADSSAPDLNMIPLAAIDRIEVLRDGASSLYGTDAIGGVINFITRKDFTGGVASAQYSQPQHAGGKTTNLNVGYGRGDLDQDKYNLFGFIDYQKQDPITTQQRDYTRASASLKTSGTGYPGSYSQGGDNYSVDAPGCTNPFGVSAGTYCRYAYANWVDLIPKSERASGLVRGTFNLGGDTRAALEYFGSETKVWTNIAPVPFAALTVNPGTRYYPGNGIIPAPPAGSGIDPTQPLDVRWRDVPNGARADRSDNKQQRLLASLDGSNGAWDWASGVSYNENKVTNYLTGGYTNGDIITPAVADGTLNPFSTQQDAAGQAVIAAAGVTGPLWTAKGQTVTLDGHASRELGDWFGSGRKSALAVGAEFRREQYHQNANASVASQVVASSGFDPTLNNGGSRNVYAMYAELNMPVTKRLEATAAARYDHYSDFGSTFNPKVSVRWQPMDTLLMRGSVSTGFRAPSLFDLYASPTFTNTANTWDDPVRCPGGPGTGPSNACQQQFEALTGGNTKLKPEKSRSGSLGFVLQPTSQFDFGLDFWWVVLHDQIGALTDTSVFGDPTKYASQFKRAPDGSLSYDGTQCPGANCGYVLLNTQNLGSLITNGVDLTTSYRWKLASGASTIFRMAGTYVSRYDYQTEAGGQWFRGAGAYTGITTAQGGGPIIRWQYTASVTYAASNWSVGLANRFKRGYADQNGGQVGDWSVIDVFGSYSPTKALTLTAGVRNIFDQAPPFSNQTATFQLGYDPRVADPFGRTFYLRGTYKF